MNTSNEYQEKSAIELSADPFFIDAANAYGKSLHSNDGIAISESVDAFIAGCAFRETFIQEIHKQRNAFEKALVKETFENTHLSAENSKLNNLLNISNENVVNMNHAIALLEAKLKENNISFDGQGASIMND